MWRGHGSARADGANGHGFTCSVRPAIDPERCVFCRTSCVKVRSIMLLKKLRKDQSGATAVEYGIMVAAIAAVIIATVFLVGQQTQIAFGDLYTEWAALVGQ